MKRHIHGESYGESHGTFIVKQGFVIIILRKNTTNKFDTKHGLV
jgi:hypothetical protein